MAVEAVDDIAQYRLEQIENEVRGPHGVVARMEHRMDGMERKLSWILGLLLTGMVTALVGMLAHL